MSFNICAGKVTWALGAFYGCDLMNVLTIVIWQDTQIVILIRIYRFCVSVMCRFQCHDSEVKIFVIKIIGWGINFLWL